MLVWKKELVCEAEGRGQGVPGRGSRLPLPTLESKCLYGSWLLLGLVGRVPLMKPCSPADGQSLLSCMAVVSKENSEETSRKLPCPSAVWKNGPEKGPGEMSRRRK